MDSRYYERAPHAIEQDFIAREFISRVYGWMGVGLALTAVISLLTVQSPTLLRLFVYNPILRWGLLLGELGLVIYLSARISKMTVGAATGGFVAYAAMNGLTLSVIFLIYTAASITSVFFVTAGTFAAMSAIGYVTKKDLSGIGSFCLMGLIGVIIASIVNLFVRSSMLDWLLSVLGVLIFIGLTAYDTQKIKNLARNIDPLSDAATKTAILGALTLYLDFINLFLYMLRFFGQRRDD
ncbi:MAG: Bax inhibitor-1/YccA family protein [Acidobacteria bacterium]|nr:Bax inhibitor-1/YccA family protein [Acidobacteriota bacterium]MBI3655464.1 Bax inhibitor-1/YccA family protein [Acidobacteriota bacterium]